MKLGLMLITFTSMSDDHGQGGASNECALRSSGPLSGSLLHGVNHPLQHGCALLQRHELVVEGLLCRAAKALGLSGSGGGTLCGRLGRGSCNVEERTSLVLPLVLDPAQILVCFLLCVDEGTIMILCQLLSRFITFGSSAPGIDESR